MANKPPNKRMDLLKDRNAKLSAQVAVQRKEIDRLQGSLEDLHRKDEQRQDTVLCINRLWEELNSSISFLSFKATGTLTAPSNGADENGDADLLEEANPFLAKLLSSSFMAPDKATTAASKGLVEDISEVEATLRQRMKCTMEAATRVLEALEEGRAAVAGTPRDGGTPSAGSASKESQLAAMNNLLKAENNRLRDQALKDAVKIKELQSGLADREDELLVAQRKILQLKEAPGMPSAPAAAPPAAEDDGGGEAPSSSQPAASTVAEIAHYKQVLERREAEIEERDAALSKSDREVRDLRAKLASERDSAARARQYANDRANHLTAELDSLDARLRDLHRERDHILGRMHAMEMHVEQGIAAERRLSQARAHIASLEGQVASTRAKRAEAEEAYDRLKASLGNAPTSEELSKMVASLKDDVASLRKSRDKYKEAAEGAESARNTAAEASRGLAEAQAQLETVRVQLQTAREEAAGWAAERKAAAEREEELRLFAEVAQTFLGSSSAETEAEAMKQQISQFLQEQSAAVAERLDGAAAAAAGGPSPREIELLARTGALEEERAKLTARVESLQKESESLRAEAAGLREDFEAVMREVESVTEAYAAAQDQNQRLLKSIETRDEDNLRLLREAAQANRERSSHVEEKDVAVEAARRAEDLAAVSASRAEELETRVQTLSTELEKARKEVRQLSARADAAMRDKAAAQAAVDAATRDAEAARKEAAERASERDAEAEALRKERTKAQRAQNDAAELQTRAARLERAASGALAGSGGELVAENAALRKMVNCNVCHARMKDRIITKCNHIFCSHCIDANLATRHRKCPGCGDRFGAADVKPFFFT